MRWRLAVGSAEGRETSVCGTSDIGVFDWDGWQSREDGLRSLSGRNVREM